LHFGDGAGGSLFSVFFGFSLSPPSLSLFSPLLSFGSSIGLK